MISFFGVKLSEAFYLTYINGLLHAFSHNSRFLCYACYNWNSIDSASFMRNLCTRLIQVFNQYRGSRSTCALGSWGRGILAYAGVAQIQSLECGTLWKASEASSIGTLMHTYVTVCKDAGR